MEKSVEERIVHKLLQKGYSFTCAESCTGGMLSARIVSVPGVSEVYNCGFVTYANSAKHKLIGVSEETLNTVGAVSEQCAREMAIGAAIAAEAETALSITGIAGPGGGTPEKPVGTVYIGCHVCGTTIVKRFLFEGDRLQIRQSSVETALNLLDECLTAE